MLLPDYKVSRFYGLNTNIKDVKTFKSGWSPDSLNWITAGKEGDHIELRRGYKLLGLTRNEDVDGKVTGLGVALRYDAVEIPFFSHTRKIKYYDVATDDMVEVSTDLLPVAASGEDVWFEKYQSLAGSFIYLGSLNSSIYKIPAANPGSAVDQLVNNYRFGVFHFGESRSFAGQRNGITAGNNDKTGIYLSYIDKALLSSYTQVTGEAFGTGDGAEDSFTYTLRIKQATFTVTIATPGVFTSTGHGLSAGNKVVFSTTGVLPTGLVAGTTYYVMSTGLTADAFQVSATEGGAAINTTGSQSGTHTVVKGNKKTVMYISITDGVETFIDDRNGNMVGNAGGVGTVNYATGAISISFAVAPANLAAITCSYYWEDSTSTGVLDYSGGAEGQGKSFRQDDGGNFMAIFNLNVIEYCFHLLKTWQLTTTLDDTGATNLDYRNVGIPYPRAACQTPEGILFADLARPNDPKFRRLQVLEGTTNTTIEPKSISDNLDLSPYAYDYCVAFRWGDYEIFCVQEILNDIANTHNSIMLVRNVLSGAWSKLNYYASCLAVYDGALIAGDSLSNNMNILFSGWDEDGDIIANYYISEDSNLGTEQLKNARRMVINGLIQPSQSVKVSISYDNGAFSEVYTIEGDAEYVDSGIDTYIGGSTIGSHTLGSGGSDTAHPFEVDFPISSPKFNNARVKFEALDIGYVAINSYEYKDVRDKGRKRLPIRTI